MHPRRPDSHPESPPPPTTPTARARWGLALEQADVVVLGADVVHAQEIAGGPTNERAPIAPGLGESGAGGKSMAAASGVGVEGIDLPDVWRDGVKTRRVGDHLGTLAALAAVHGGGQTAEESGIIIGRGAEHVARFIEAHTPCVVVELM